MVNAEPIEPKPLISPRHDFPLPEEVRTVYDDYRRNGSSPEHWPRPEVLPIEVRFVHDAEDTSQN